MENRRKIEIAVAILVIVLFVALLMFFMRKEQAPVDTTPNDTGTPVNNEVSAVDPDDIPPQSEVAASTVARSFVERFGSYSSETDFINVEDVIPLATVAFAEELETLAERARRDADDGYYGISTIVLSTKATSTTDTQMTFLIMTQREEAVGSPADATVRYQNITVDLEKSGDDWLVSGFEWQE